MNRFLIVALLFSMCCPLCRASTNQAVRVALVDASAETPLPSGLLDLLLVGFSQEGIDLVERQDLRVVFQERNLAGAVPGGFDVPVQLVGADTFLTLEMVAVSADMRGLRVRLFETRYGLKAFDRIFPMGSDSEYEPQIRELISLVKVRLADGDHDHVKLVPVSVSAFRNEEVAEHSISFLSAVITSSLEGMMAQYGRVAILEREKISHLSRERDLVGGLPARIAASAILLDGSYKLNRSKGPEAVTLYVRARRGIELLEQEFETEIADIHGVIQQVANLVAARFLGDAERGALSPEIEAGMLAAEARRNLHIGEPALALGPAEAAVALAPENREYRRLLFHVIHGFVLRVYRDAEDRPEAFLRMSNWYHRAYDIAEGLLKSATPQTVAKTGLEPVLGLLDPLPQDLPLREYPNPDLKRVFNDIQARQPEIYRLYSGCADWVRRNPKILERWDKSKRLRLVAVPGYAWYPSAAEALAARRRMYEEAVELIRTAEYPRTGLQPLLEQQLKVSPTWDDRHLAHEIMISFFEDLYEEEEPLLRFTAAHALLWLQYGRTTDALRCEQAYTAAKNLCQVSVRELYAPYPGLRTVLDMFSRNSSVNARFSTDPQQDRALRDELLAWYEQEKAAALGLPVKKKAAAKPAPKPASPFTMMEKLSTKQVCEQLSHVKEQDIWFRRLIQTPAGLALLYGERYRTYGWNRYGVYWLDPDSFRILRHQKWTGQIKRSQRYSEDNHGPQVDIYQNEIYVGTPDSGLLVFSAEKEARALTMENGLVSNSIWQPVIIGDTLYAMVEASSPHNCDGIMALNLRTEVSRILFSVRDKKKSTPLHGRRFRCIAKNLGASKLLMLTDNERLYTYDAFTEDIRRLSVPYLEDPKYYFQDGLRYLNFRGPFITLNMHYPGIIDTRTAMAIPLPIDFMVLGGLFGRTVPAGRGVVGLRPGFVKYWDPGRPKILDVAKRKAAGHFLDVLATEQGLFILTQKQLYLVPEISGIPEFPSGMGKPIVEKDELW